MVVLMTSGWMCPGRQVAEDADRGSLRCLSKLADSANHKRPRDQR